MLLKHIIHTVIFLILFFNIASAQTNNQGVPMLAAESYSNIPDPFFADKVWHRYQTENFTILSLQKDQGQYLYENIENIKGWIFSRWGFPNIKFSAECRIVCVPSVEIIEKLFKVDGSRVESREEDGRIKLHVIWLVMDSQPTKCLPSALSMIAITELERQNNLKIPFWACRGMSVLNLSLSQIRGEMDFINKRITNKEKLYSSKVLFTMTREQFLQLDVDSKKIYDAQSAVLCLMFRKEFGQRNFLQFISRQSTEYNLKQIIGFENFNIFEKTFQRYMYYLSKDVVDMKTPQEYLEINPVVNNYKEI